MRLADSLKDAISLKALQGELTTRYQNDTPVSETLKSIREYKHELQKQNQIAKDKEIIPLSESVSSISIPEEWKLVTLQSITQQITDGEHKTPHRVSNFQGFYLLSARNVTNEGILLNDVDYVDKSEYDRISKRCNPRKGDILISCSGSVGRACVINDDNNYVMVRSAAMVRCISVLPEFICFAIKSPYVQAQIDELKKQSVQANLFQGAIASLLIPLPPIEEQQRIIENINGIIPILDEYEEVEDQLVALKNQFPADMRDAILQSAIQGKLTEQLDSDTPVDTLISILADEKNENKTKRRARAGVNIDDITSDEIPFEIPDTWKFIRIIDLCKNIIAGGDKPKLFTKEKTEQCQIEVISNGETNKGIFGYTDEPTVTDRCLTVSGRGTIGYTEIREKPFVPIVRLLVLLPLPHTNLEYLQYALEALIERGSGTAVKQLTVPMLSPQIIPLPPAEEQERIVQRLNELLSLCDGLKES